MGLNKSQKQKRNELRIKSKNRGSIFLSLFEKFSSFFFFLSKPFSFLNINNYLPDSVLGFVIGKIIFILVSLIPFYLLWEEEGPLRLIVIPFVFIILSSFIFILKSLQDLLCELSPIDSNYVENKILLKDNIIYKFAIFLFPISILFTIFQIDNFQNTFGGFYLFWNYAFLGIIIALILCLLFRLLSNTLFKISSRRTFVFLSLFLSLFHLTPMVASSINMSFAYKSSCHSFFVISKEVFTRKRNDHFQILLKTRYGEEDFEVSEDEWNNIEVNKKINVQLIEGFLGYTILDRVIN